jgi:two-component system NarL family sensor kinase
MERRATIGVPAPVEPERLVALLRLPAIGVLLLSRTLPHPNAEPEWFYLGLALYCVWSFGALGWTWWRETGERLAALAIALDVAFFTVLTALSGGPFSNARFAYLVVPVVVAFRMRPRLTALASVAVIVAYVGQALAHPAASLENAERVILTFSAMLLWMGTACVLLSVLLAERTNSIVDLLASRTVLLTETLTTEERERRGLAEGLHDHAMQSLISAKQDLDELDDAIAPPEALRARDALDVTLGELRAAIFQLHPYVLDEIGLAPAIRAVAEQVGDRAGLGVRLDLAAMAPSRSDQLLYSAARELISNVAKHAGAGTLSVTLFEADGVRHLVVEDDGCGLDLARTDAPLRDGHIGLASQRVRVEAAGGSLVIVARPGEGLRAEVTVPG